ncbi:unnamed protein product [Ceratitis capitata]|uniref:(Mediterranean fruit fly) hypothetical protein n=1 Tax=Ceratitis capitata TaxID=7213 RepID=A0A811UZ06_CERCA|nr:unnamed protein product [Ceratitis capitata]
MAHYFICQYATECNKSVGSYVYVAVGWAGRQARKGEGGCSVGYFSLALAMLVMMVAALMMTMTLVNNACQRATAVTITPTTPTTKYICLDNHNNDCAPACWQSNQQ